MTEQFAYRAFLAVVGGGLVLMTIGLAATWVFLLRRNLRLPREPRHAEPRPGPTAPDGP